MKKITQKKIGAKTGIFCSSPNIVPGSGYAAFDWFRIDNTTSLIKPFQ